MTIILAIATRIQPRLNAPWGLWTLALIFDAVAINHLVRNAS